MMNLLLENLNIQLVLILILALVSYFSYRYKTVKLVAFSFSLILLNFMFYQEFLVKTPQGFLLLVFVVFAMWVNFSLYLFFYKNSYKSISLRFLYIIFLLLIKYLNLGYFNVEEVNFLFATDLNSSHFYSFLNYLIYFTKNYSFFQLLFLLVPGGLSMEVFLESQDMRMYMLKNSKVNMDNLIIKIKEQSQLLPPSKIVLPKLERVTPEFLTKTTPFYLLCFEPLANKTSLNDLFKFKAQNNAFIKYFQELAQNEQAVAFLQKHLKNYRVLTEEAFLFKRLVVPYNHQLNFQQLEICFQKGYKDVSPALAKELLKSLQMTAIIENGQKLQENEIDINKALARLQSDRPISREIASLRKPESAINSISQAQTIASNLLACDAVLVEEQLEVDQILQSNNDFFISTKNAEKIKFEVKNIYQLFDQKGFDFYLKDVFAKHIFKLEDDPSAVEVEPDAEICATRLIVALDRSLEPTTDMNLVIEKFNKKYAAENIVFSLRKI